jgi:CBS-domain-containing membrane protein
VSSGLHQLPVLTADGKIAGFVDESQVTRAFLASVAEPREAVA